jgi:hypothetical protein
LRSSVSLRDIYRVVENFKLYLFDGKNWLYR